MQLWIFMENVGRMFASFLFKKIFKQGLLGVYAESVYEVHTKISPEFLPDL